MNNIIEDHIKKEAEGVAADLSVENLKKETIPRSVKELAEEEDARCLKKMQQMNQWISRLCMCEDIGDFSDGYHTFKELYRYRMLYNAALFNEWAVQGLYSVHKSRRHSDGELCFGGGWFVVVAVLPTGQITNHYELKDWDLFKIADTDKAMFEYDGHTPQEAADRLERFLKRKSKGSFN